MKVNTPIYGNLPYEPIFVVREATVGANGEWSVKFPEVQLSEVVAFQATASYNTYDTAKTPTGVNVTYCDTDEIQGTALKGTSLGLLVGVANLWAEPGTKIQVQVIGFKA